MPIIEKILDFFVWLTTDRILEGFETMEDAGTFVNTALNILSYLSTPLGICILIIVCAYLKRKS